MVVVFLLQATVDAGRLFQFQGDDANNGGAAIISLPSDNKAGDRCVRMHTIPMKAYICQLPALNFVLLNFHA